MPVLPFEVGAGFDIAAATFEPAGFAVDRFTAGAAFAMGFARALVVLGFFIDAIVSALCSAIVFFFAAGLAPAVLRSVAGFAVRVLVVAVMRSQFTTRVRLWAGGKLLLDRELPNKPVNMFRLAMDADRLIQEAGVAWDMEFDVVTAGEDVCDWLDPLEWHSEGDGVHITGRPFIKEVIARFEELHRRLFIEEGE